MDAIDTIDTIDTMDLKFFRQSASLVGKITGFSGKYN
jgi:hypothetical protein